MVIGMLRLGIWQLDRAAFKQTILDQVQQQASSEPQTPGQLIDRLISGETTTELRFQPVKASGTYLGEQSILIENQVHNNQGGYKVITPMRVEGADQLVMVSRGWVAAGITRQDLPTFSTPSQRVEIVGRLNFPPAQPPLWKDGYPVANGSVWQYLPIDDFAQQIGAQVLPLVVELAPENEGSEGLQIYWQSIDDKWVAKHKGYAFQWFAMALAFFIACLVLLVRARQSKQL